MLAWVRKKMERSDNLVSESALSSCQRNAARLDKRKAEKIVNQYGKALKAANKQHANKVFRIISRMTRDSELYEEICENLEKNHGYYFAIFSHKVDKSLLPYPKEKIKEAIEMLLRFEKDVDNIKLLKAGLQYLNFFD
ncbi:MAG TPA: hypothetical protein ENG51_04865 [Deltaproteobacteria bacterium]|nr:hypothetical protein [Deltaproteobacteria bacterium]